MIDTEKRRGRKPKRPEDRTIYKNTTISGKPEELDKLKKLAADAGKTVSRFVLESLLK